jgi:hypothetical protein
MTTPRKTDTPSDKGFLPVPEPTPQGVPVEVPYDLHVEPVPSALLLLSDRVATLEEAIAGLLHTVSDQQGSLAQLQQQMADLAALFTVEEDHTGLVGLAVTPEVAAAVEALFAFIKTDQKFAYDLGLAARRQEKVRHGPLTGLLQAIAGTQVEDGT